MTHALGPVTSAAGEQVGGAPAAVGLSGSRGRQNSTRAQRTTHKVLLTRELLVASLSPEAHVDEQLERGECLPGGRGSPASLGRSLSCRSPRPRGAKLQVTAG